MTTVGTPILWIGFTLLILALLALDLLVFHREAHKIRFREAVYGALFWIGLALLFGLAVYYKFGSERALEYYTGFIIEKALSVDNVFVFIVIFAFFRTPSEYQHRVLFWGILGALVMRAIFIFAGAALLARFHWVLYIFGAILIFTGIRMMSHKEDDIHPEKNIVYRLFRRVVPMVHGYHGQKFFVVENGRRFATPLLLVLVIIEATDVVFAVDSIPAVFGITTDPFIVYTSNIFAILGLRNLFFVVIGFIEKFHLLRYGLAVVLLFVGAKMLIGEWYKIPIGISLLVVLGVLALSIVLSILRPLPPAEIEQTERLAHGDVEVPAEIEELLEEPDTKT